MRKPAYIQVTRKCNNKCIFCSNPEFEEDFSFEDAKKRVMKLKKEGVNEIMLTGGEPTTCSFLPKLIDYIHYNNLHVKIISNGVNLYDENLVRELTQAGLENAIISLHSVKEETADKLSQKKGHINKTLTGIKKLIKYNINVSINSTINSLNCDHLSKNATYIIKKFPKIKHFIYNNLDPGSADGDTKSRAGENPWIVPKFTDFKQELHKCLKILKQNKKTFRVERVPLCYMPGFESFSTETRKIVKNEKYICSFIGKNKPNNIKRATPLQLREKVKCCKICKLDPICGGIDSSYLQIHGDSEIYPVYKDPSKIIRKIQYED